MTGLPVQQPRMESETPSGNTWMPSRMNWNDTNSAGSVDSSEASGNMVIIIVAIVMLCVSRDEKPNTPIRAWIIVYAAQALVQVILSIASAFSSGHRALRRSLVVCQSLNVLFFLAWWILGMYWVIHGGETLMDDATRLFWTAVVFLALPLIAVTLFCLCLPCFCCCGACIAGLFAVAN